MFRSRFCLCVLCALLASALLALLFVLGPPHATAQAPVAQAAQAPKGPISYINDVVPIFKENCFSCHDPKKRKGKLDMTTYEAFKKGGDNDEPFVVNKPEESRIMNLLTTNTARRMPPKENGEPLPKAKIAIIEQWIKEGAKADVNPKADLLRELRVRWKPPPPPPAYKFPWVVNSLAFTPDGKKIVVGGHHELTVWDIEAAKLEKRIATRPERAKAMLFLPDGKLVVAGSRPGQEGDVRIYDINGGNAKDVDGVAMLDGVNPESKVLLKVLPVGQDVTGDLFSTDDEMLCLAASEDGKRLAAGGWDRLVRVWDLSAGIDQAKLEQTSENHADVVLGIALAPDGKHMLTASRDKTAKVWDLAAKESVLTFAGHQVANQGLPVYGVGVSADSKIGYSVGEDGNLRRWNALTDGKEVGNAAAHAKGAFKLVMNPKQPIMVTCGADNTAKIWTLAGQAQKTLTGHTDHVLAAAISPDATLVATGSFNGEVKIWKVDPKEVKPFKEFIASPGYVLPAPAPKKD